MAHLKKIGICWLECLITMMPLLISSLKRPSLLTLSNLDDFLLIGK